ncbi:bifunctional alpha,alpha-trehalose-phosphate synthase (UDP-forming)/trehalose-phosphatase [Flavobacterium sp. J49]|uniref:bifunctional alpha,alpha-trehalose-phosphate synthase (UDP-forming)/trehalose-phosphatase n=1 Tax=Flavobacterium sp. J49 TaxID=2718534 RepID=UPI00159359AE|nr:bifunctional alpha,alpha-trehalose-phosphate synthase (UDP-forming)/trehalose-phosphatase [Flavobacterium sp. J49]MBF6640288.1 bifunctional alpha,alpha-trehalose-phosphate synthase (UDP-forming)/trehalose-phosphatase [Flavobacterium sp. J49]NIC01533.1 bifunctional alpha,alpha-trehalose-phosphate synthase (UDP-forming)/trehalose-phosphatase [Flavobacterium sp. J49]
MNTKTIIVANRLPIEFKISSNTIEIKPSVGGLATGLNTVHKQGKSLWVGWSGLAEEQLNDVHKEKIRELASQAKCVTVSLKEKEIEEFYFGFSNKALWPLFHYFLEFTTYEPEQWETYVKVNEQYADAVLQHAADGDKIWIHDYQLLLLPKMLRDRRPSLSIGFFLHIPFPAFEIFRTCPWREELLQGMLGADLIGFHTYDYVQHFLNSVRRILGLTVKFNEIMQHNRTIKADSFPMGIDYNNFYNTAQLHKHRNNREVSEIMSKLNEHIINYPDSKLILSIDRMDYTKGIPNRIRAFEYFLEKYPQYLGKVRLMMLAVPSRSNVPQYRKLKKDTDELVGRINGKFATIDWTPIWYFYRSMPFDDLIDLYSFSQIALITPLRDGMNLVAKEFIATRTKSDGVLILSEMAGAASEMHEALLINPNNADQFAAALHQALEMSPEEQKTRILALQKRLSRYTVDKWALDFIKSLNETCQTTTEHSISKLLDKLIMNKMLTEFKTAKNKLFLLDYDGTLVNFRGNPENASPDIGLYDLLDNINKNTNTEIVIISGRGRDSIEKWFGHKNYTLITDHGIWIRRKDKEWLQLEDPKTEWKEIIRPIMESFVDRTPGAFVEEKKYSLAWHYRKADPDMAEIRMRELKILLTGFVSENGLSVLDGSMVLEVKNNIVNKGRAVLNLISGTQADFIFAAGDDHTDEFMFEVMPNNAYTVKIGRSESIALYYVNDIADIRSLLANFELKQISSASQ